MGGNLNRVLEFYKNWEKEETQLKQIGGRDVDAKDLLKAKYDYLSKGVYRVSINPGIGEQLALGMMKGVLKNLEKQIYPSRFLRAVHQLKVAVIDRPNYIDRFIKDRKENLRLIDMQLKSRGLDQYFGKLDQYLDFERSEVGITLPASLNTTTNIDFRIGIEKNSNGLYQLSGLEVKTAFADQPEKNRSFEFSEDFQLTANKAANLMMGRAVINGSSNQWVQLENAHDPGNDRIKVYQQDHGYNLERVLNDLASEIGIYRITAADFIHELKQGHQVKLNGRHPADQPVFIEASPGTGGVIILDPEQNIISVDQMFMGTRLAQEKQQQNHLSVVSEKTQSNLQDQSRGIGS